jgi:hypothetical protein
MRHRSAKTPSLPAEPLPHKRYCTLRWGDPGLVPESRDLPIRPSGDFRRWPSGCSHIRSRRWRPAWSDRDVLRAAAAAAWTRGRVGGVGGNTGRGGRHERGATVGERAGRMANCAGRLKIRESDRCRADRQDRAFHENAHLALDPVSPCDQLAEPPHSRT